ncbi:MAG: hypothetical protein ACT6FF_09235 [Methanosarcinaceae archaeon]
MAHNLNFDDDIYNLRNKITQNQANSHEMKRYLNLLLESSDYNRNVVENYIHEIGYESVNDFQEHFNEKNNKELIDGLLLIGGAVLFGYLLNKIAE